MSTITHIEALITNLTLMKEDAEKFDKGMVGAPGTRIRKEAQSVIGGLKTLRAAISDARKAKAA